MTGSVARRPGEAGPILFFGSPAFALPTLRALIAAGRRPDLVVSQPARPAGRGQRPRQPAVAKWALEHDLELDQPARVREPEFLARVRALDPWVAVVVAFGQIFPQSLLDIPRLGCINLHGSLLPRYRGAAPIQAAIAAGDRETGVTTMRMERGLDSGPMLLAAPQAIGADETTPELAERLAILGADLMVETLDRLAAGNLEPRRQDDRLATHAPQVRKEDGRVDWSQPAQRIRNLKRAYTPWPGLVAELGDRPVKLVQVGLAESAETTAEAGTLLDVDGDALRVACGEGTVLRIARVQRPDRRAVSGRDLFNGERLAVGERFS